jgi:hypothetical protein
LFLSTLFFSAIIKESREEVNVMSIDAEKFALAVVSSSNPDLSISDKVKLYEETVEFIENHNQEKLEEAKQRVKDWLI